VTLFLAVKASGLAHEALHLRTRNEKTRSIGFAGGLFQIRLAPLLFDRGCVILNRKGVVIGLVLRLLFFGLRGIGIATPFLALRLVLLHDIPIESTAPHKVLEIGLPLSERRSGTLKPNVAIQIRLEPLDLIRLIGALETQLRAHLFEIRNVFLNRARALLKLIKLRSCKSNRVYGAVCLEQ
jgi:hypothetical protein